MMDCVSFHLVSKLKATPPFQPGFFNLEKVFVIEVSNWAAAGLGTTIVVILNFLEILGNKLSFIYWGQQLLWSEISWIFYEINWVSFIFSMRLWWSQHESKLLWIFEAKGGNHFRFSIDVTLLSLMQSFSNKKNCVERDDIGIDAGLYFM